MDGSADLGALLAGLEPALRPDGYVFCALTDRVIPADLAPLLIFQEDEGTTLVLRGSDARRIGMPDSTAWAWISLEVRSSLEAVGLLAAVSAELAAHGITRIRSGPQHQLQHTRHAHSDESGGRAAQMKKTKTRHMFLGGYYVENKGA